MLRRFARVLAIAVALLLVAELAGSSSSSGSHAHRAVAGQRPNIVFVLTDDLAWNLVSPRFMPHVVGLERNGETFTRYIVSDSLCCPSRSTIFTGLFPHDTGVFTNVGKDGGYYAFTHHKPDLETRTFAVATQHAGYMNSMMGKYLNRYGEPAMTTYVPPGWSDWHVGGNAYSEFNYTLNEDRAVVHYGGPPPAGHATNYLTDVLASRARTFIDQAASANKPFVLEVATFAPHFPYTPAPRNAADFPGLRAPRDASFNAINLHPPDWLGSARKLTAHEVAQIDAEFRMRAQAVEAVDRLLAGIESELADAGSPATPTSCSARTTAITWASTGCSRANRPRLTLTFACH